MQVWKYVNQNGNIFKILDSRILTDLTLYHSIISKFSKEKSYICMLNIKKKSEKNKCYFKRFQQDWKILWFKRLLGRKCCYTNLQSLQLMIKNIYIKVNLLF